MLLLPLLLAACGDQASPVAQPVAAVQQQGGVLVSLAQAQQAARQWWNDHEQALVHRDVAALTRLEADPGVLPTLEALRTALATGRGLLPAVRQPGAVRVHVPAAQSWPVPILAVIDLADDRGGTVHLAELFMARSSGAELVSLEAAALDGPEPAFAVDAQGYVRSIAPADQASVLGRRSDNLSALYSRSMETAARNPGAALPDFAAGRETTQIVQRDAARIAGAAAGRSPTIGGVDLHYIDLNFPTPVFALEDGGGFTLFAAERDETLTPKPGQAFLQDAQRHNFGAELAPGQYAQIAMRSIVVVAVRMPTAGAPLQPLGMGGGVYNEG